MRDPIPVGGSNTPAQRRTIATALELFGEHGVAGTSLQMIADAQGVTKAAIYYQFRTKEEIVLAIAGVGLRRLADALDAAEAAPTSEEAREIVLGSVIDLALERREWVRVLHRDPAIIRLMARYEPFVALLERLQRVLAGGVSRSEVQVETAAVSAAIGAAVVHPLVAGVDDETLRRELLRIADRVL